MSTARIGFVGLGAMGGAMARRLVSQGFTVAGRDILTANAERAGATGVKIVGSAAEAADGADVVLSSPRSAPRCTTWGRSAPASS